MSLKITSDSGYRDYHKMQQSDTVVHLMFEPDQDRKACRAKAPAAPVVHYE
jgi:hypothetical protein